MEVVKQSQLWQRTLAPQTEDTPSTSEARERLRASFTSFRDKAATLADEIPREIRNLTVHDISHIDALWGIADLIAGKEYLISPAEAYVLGGAFLLHDLGLALAAYPNGIDELKQKTEWLDVESANRRRLSNQYSGVYNETDFENAIERETIESLLRKLHAEQAEKLATVEFYADNRSPKYFLIEDTDLRETYGPLIGQIAFSHWWPIELLNSKLQPQVGAFPHFPHGWTIDPIKLACLLRTADACHLDSRRAPGFLRALRKPTGFSDVHWRFQEYIQQPIAHGQQLKFTSSKPMPAVDREAWWLAFDALSIADRELRDADALLRDSNRDPFSITGVAGANDPARLRRYIPTDGWEPVDTSLRVSNVASLVAKLGGTATYGDTSYVPLRELIQNARDAVVARRLQENRHNSWGEIVVSHLTVDDEQYITVEDNGLGMSKALLSGPFLDFGTSYWNSELMMREHPGLAARNFQPEGKFGIGFFSVFMWGDDVKLITRSSNCAKSNTLVLEFKTGLSERPVLRVADIGEQRHDPGTSVKIRLRSPQATTKSLLTAPLYAVMSIGPQPFQTKRRSWSLEELCEWLCTTIDVDITVNAKGEKRNVVKANDWLTLPPKRFFDRLLLHHPDRSVFSSSDIWKVSTTS
jgi:hypothetical protein